MTDQSMPLPESTLVRLPSDLGTSKPVPVAKPEPKRTLEHPIVKACGHRIDLRHPPTKANCEECWRAFFAEVVNTAELHKLLVERGRAGMERMLGNKFVKQFGKHLQRELRSSFPKTEPGIDGSVLDIGAERLANGIRQEEGRTEGT